MPPSAPKAQLSAVPRGAFFHGLRPAAAQAFGQRYQGNNNGFWDLQERTMPVPDGWRTPTIEDSSHRANNSRVVDYPFPHDQVHRQRVTPSEGVEVVDKVEDPDDEKPKNLSWSQRMKHVSWAWFTLTMATGGIANVLHTGNVPFRPGLLEPMLQRPTDDSQYLTASMVSTRSASFSCYSTSCSTSSSGP